MVEYRSQGEELISDNEALLESLAHEYAASGTHPDDLFQEGALALLTVSNYQRQQDTETQIKKGMQKHIGREKRQAKLCRGYKLSISGEPIEATS